MKIKTSKEIRLAGFNTINQMNAQDKKKWVAVEDVRQFFKDNMFKIPEEIIQKFEKEVQ